MIAWILSHCWTNSFTPSLHVHLDNHWCKHFLSLLQHHQTKDKIIYIAQMRRVGDERRVNESVWTKSKIKKTRWNQDEELISKCFNINQFRVKFLSSHTRQMNLMNVIHQVNKSWLFISSISRKPSRKKIANLIANEKALNTENEMEKKSSSLLFKDGKQIEIIDFIHLIGERKRKLSNQQNSREFPLRLVTQIAKNFVLTMTTNMIHLHKNHHHTLRALPSWCTQTSNESIKFVNVKIVHQMSS
jgi:hypothetical protein